MMTMRPTRLRSVPLRLLASGALALFAAGASGGAVLAAKWDSPETLDERDIALPLPRSDGEDWHLVVRRVDVPGDRFWEDDGRFVELGESGDSDVFERPVSVEMRGATRADDGWHIWLGKYETTIAQYALVMGEGDLGAGLEHYIEASGRDREFRASVAPGAKGRETTIAAPVERLAPSQVQSFLRALNTLCYAHTACREALPDVGAAARDRDARYLPFFRLPTELEWEYAARGAGDGRADYRDRLPVSDKKIGDFAQLERVRSIGRKKPLFGFHDLFGNVAELVDGRMSVRIGDPGAGAWLARGGKALKAFSKTPYSAQREEILEFEWQAGDEAPVPVSLRRIGFRVALGSSLQSFEKLALEEKPRKGATREPTSADPGAPAAPIRSGDMPVVNELIELAAALREGGGDARLAGRLDSALERLQDEEDKRNARLARFVADSAWVKIVRLWSVVSRTGKNARILATTERLAKAGRLNPKATAARENIARQMETDQLVVKRLAQEYESALLATAAVPGVDAGVVEAIDTETFTQSPEQIALATAALKLLGEHIETLGRGERLDVRRALEEAYPLAR